MKRLFPTEPPNFSKTPFPFELETLPANPNTHNPNSFGHGFNITRIVSEYGPKRIEEINAEIQKLQDKIDKLTLEKEGVQRMLDVL